MSDTSRLTSHILARNNVPHSIQKIKPQTSLNIVLHISQDIVLHTSQDNVPHTGQDNVPHTSQGLSKERIETLQERIVCNRPMQGAENKRMF